MKLNLFIVNIASVALLLLLFSDYTIAQSIYTFERLTLHRSLNGQDNWIDQVGQGTASIYLDTTRLNGTKVVRPVPTIAFNEYVYITRENDSSYSFPELQGNEIEIQMQFDLTGDGVALFALGNDWNADNRLSAADGEIGPSFGTSAQHFVIQSANADTIIQEPLASGNSRFDWYRMQFRINLKANNGSASGSLYYLNLSDGDVIYQPVPNLQNIDLQLNNMNPNANPKSWNTMWVKLLRDGGNEPSVDNLYPLEVISKEADPDTTVTLVENTIKEKSSFNSSCSPNPFSRSTSIKYSIEKSNNVKLSIYNSQGLLISELLNRDSEPGKHEVIFDGSQQPSGYYYYKLETKDKAVFKRIMLVK